MSKNSKIGGYLSFYDIGGEKYMVDYQVTCDFDTLFRLREHFEGMDFKAGEYVPSEKDMERYVKNSNGKYMDFFLWIDETGTDTPENHEQRKSLHEYINKHLKLVESIGDST